MTQYNTLNVKLSNSRLNKLKLKIKNDTTFENLVKLELTNTQVSRIRKAFENGESTNMKLSIP